jgi:hypothetical protein
MTFQKQLGISSSHWKQCSDVEELPIENFLTGYPVEDGGSRSFFRVKMGF